MYHLAIGSPPLHHIGSPELYTGSGFPFNSLPSLIARIGLFPSAEQQAAGRTAPNSADLAGVDVASFEQIKRLPLVAIDDRGDGFRTPNWAVKVGMILGSKCHLHGLHETATARSCRACRFRFVKTLPCVLPCSGGVQASRVDRWPVITTRSA